MYETINLTRRLFNQRQNALQQTLHAYVSLADIQIQHVRHERKDQLLVDRREGNAAAQA